MSNPYEQANGGSPVPPPLDGRPVKLRQPAGLVVLFLTEMWERFSFYGMKALLTLYLVTVIAVGSLAPGVYTNTLEVTETTKDAAGKETESVQRRVFVVAVDKPGVGAEVAPPVKSTGDPKLKLSLRQAKAQGDQSDSVPDPTDKGGPVVVSGKPGGPFVNDETYFTLTNPLAEKVKYKVAINRGGETQTYFTVNDSPTQAAGELEPNKSVDVKVLVNRKQSGMNWAKDRAGNVMAWYTGLVYLLPIFGGLIADRFLGTHRCLLIGGSIIALGHFVLMGETLTSLYAGLGLVILGTGFFKSNVSTMVGQLYHDGDPRRDAGFTIFYMGINLGAFIGPLVCGWLRNNYGWSWAFGAAGFGMILGLIVYSLGRPEFLPTIGLPPRKLARGEVKTNVPLTFEEKQRISVIFIMAFFVIFFWTAFEQASGSMAYFGEERTDRSLPEWLAFAGTRPDGGGPAFWPTEWLQSVNPLMILILAPLFAQMWVGLATRGKEPSTPAKMAIGLLTLGIGFLFMVFGALSGGDGGAKISAIWIFAAFFMHTCGELCLSPVGLSMVTKLAPLKLASGLMGTWFLANFIANFIAAQLSGQSDKIIASGFILPGYAGYFLIFVLFPCIAGVVLICLIKPLKKMMHGKG